MKVSGSIFRVNHPYRQLRRLVMSIVLIAPTISTAIAQNLSGPDFWDRYAPAVNITVGQVGVADDLDNSERYGIEYRGSPFSRFDVIPSFGYTQSGSDAEFFYGELRQDIWLNHRWVFVPSFGLGSFEDGEEIQLGNRLEFRSGVELAYRFYQNYRLGLAIFHLSNSGIGETNPGTESVVLSLNVPVNR